MNVSYFTKTQCSFLYSFWYIECILLKKKKTFLIFYLKVILIFVINFGMKLLLFMVCNLILLI